MPRRFLRVAIRTPSCLSGRFSSPSIPIQNSGSSSEMVRYNELFVITNFLDMNRKVLDATLFKKSPKTSPKLSWRLAEGGEEQISRCHDTLWSVGAELKSLSALFMSLGPHCALSDEDLHGVGLALERASRRLSKVQDRLAA